MTWLDELPPHWRSAAAEVFALMRKAERRRASRRHYAAHRDERSAKARERYAACPDKALEARKRYRETHPERVLATNRKWREANRGYWKKWRSKRNGDMPCNG